MPSLRGKKRGKGGEALTFIGSVVRVIFRVPVLSVGGQSNDIVEGEGFGVMIGGGLGVDEDGMGQFVDHHRELILHGILVVVKPK